MSRARMTLPKAGPAERYVLIDEITPPGLVERPATAVGCTAHRISKNGERMATKPPQKFALKWLRSRNLQADSFFARSFGRY